MLIQHGTSWDAHQIVNKVHVGIYVRVLHRLVDIISGIIFSERLQFLIHVNRWFVIGQSVYLKSERLS